MTSCWCEPHPPAAPPAELVLELDGVAVQRAELEPLLVYLGRIDHRLGRNARVAAILDAHVLPLRLAQRAFAARRQELHASCAALRQVIDNGGYPELVAKGGKVAGATTLTALPHELPLVVAAWVFGGDTVGQVSPVLETPQGFCLVGVWHIEHTGNTTTDRAELFFVPFYTHDAASFDAWVASARAAVADRLTFVHPDYREALPAWLPR